MAKKKHTPVDGLGPKNIEQIRKAIRQVWHWSYAKKLCIKRATGPDGFATCEQCRKRVPKVHAHHLQQVGDVDAGFIHRMFCPSSGLLAICAKCHNKETAAEKKAAKTALAEVDDFI